jgi:hypothetical protein
MLLKKIFKRIKSMLKTPDAQDRKVSVKQNSKTEIFEVLANPVNESKVSGGICEHPAEPHRIVVSSQCQTASITAAMRLLFPDRNVVPFPIIGDLSTEKELELQNLLSGADEWVTAFHPEWLDKWSLRNVRAIKIPLINFRAFHPDLAYARNHANGELINRSVHYNSLIILWAWTRGLDVETTESLFSKEIFRKLGYLNYWQTSVELLQTAFAQSDIDFHSFFLHIKRLGVFMNSINHPVQAVTHQIAILAAALIDPRISGCDIETLSVLTDPLRMHIWPVYPPIAESLSVKGSYVWKLADEIYPTLRKFIEYSFSIYQAESIGKDDVTWHFAGADEQIAILNEEIGRRK